MPTKIGLMRGLLAAAVLLLITGTSFAQGNGPQARTIHLQPAVTEPISFNGGMRKIPLMSLRQILPVDHSCVHYCELKALEICNILNHKGVTKQKCIDRSFDLCLSMIRYGDC